MKIVFASHTYMDPHLVVGSQHLAREFAKMGHSVLHLSCPITFAHLFLKKDSRYADRIDLWKKSKWHSPRLLESVPLSIIPWAVARRWIQPGRNPYSWFLPGTRRLAQHHGFLNPDLLLIDDPRLMGIETWLKPAKLIYRATDLYAQMKGDEKINLIEGWLAQKSDALVATSAPVLKHLQAYSPAKASLLLENGVELEHFMSLAHAPPEYDHIPHPRAVYVGALDERFDFAAVKNMADAEPHVQFILIGPVTSPEGDRLKNLPNVHLIGQRSYDQISPWLQHADIGLLPVNDHPANQGRSPMKLYEYAAAGLPVLSRATSEIVRRNDPFVRLYENSSQVVEALRKALGNLPSREQNSAEASKHSWSARAHVLLEFCNSIASFTQRAL